ncbi:MAG: hypothetical protein ACYSTZ_09610, partial [Planctomycetota bacterium]
MKGFLLFILYVVGSSGGWSFIIIKQGQNHNELPQTLHKCQEGKWRQGHNPPFILKIGLTINQ